MATTTHVAPRTHPPVAAVPVPPAPSAPKPGPERLVSLDAYRGFIMLTMASAGFAFATYNSKLLKQGIDSPLWQFLGYQFDHVQWVGCAFWDLIQPSFMFMVGVALPYSFASREARGDSWGKQFAHAIVRAFILILLAVFLSSPMTLPKEMAEYPWPRTNWIFPNVLAQIGLGYVFVFLLVGRGLKVQFAALAAILIGYTLFFGLWPLPESFDYTKVTDAKSWAHHMDGWFAHWNKNHNAAHYFDLWFLNLFPRPIPFRYNDGGYQTLNFVPSMATMILGLMAGELLRTDLTPGTKFAFLALAGGICLAVGWLMGEFVCPIVKRIWTPSWAVFSSGWTFAMLALFYGLIDVIGWKSWSWPLVIVGMNSIAMYMMSQLLKPWVRRSLEVHIGTWPFTGEYGVIFQTTAILVMLWVMCYWLYRQKIFLRI